MTGARDLEAEYPGAFEGVDAAGRRAVLQAMAASLALSLGACSDQPDTQALPYVHTPEFMVPGEARHYATAVVMAGYAQPVLGTTFQGRPTKLEGLPGHPASQGAADAFTQAAILGLYDPARSRGPRRAGQPSEWAAFADAMGVNAARLDARAGEGFRLLTGRQTSPTFARQLDDLMQRWPNARWHAYEPVADDPSPPLDQAAVIVCLDADPLGPGPRQTANARQWAARRRAFQQGGVEQALFVAEPTPSLTGAVATRRLACAHGRMGLLANALQAARDGAPAPAGLTDAEQAFVAAAAAAIRAAGGEAVVLTRSAQPSPFALSPPDEARSLARLLDDCRAGVVDTLLLLGANPAYAAPAMLDVAEALSHVRLKVHAGLHFDETARLCEWHAPLEHDLETWSDARAIDGRVSLIQPLVKPFYDVRSRHLLLEMAQGRLVADARAPVARTWQAAWGEGFDARWRDALRQGWIEDAPTPAAPPATPAPSASVSPGGLELVFRPDPCVWDGRFADNPFLQELPKPLNKLTWGTVLAVSPALAQARGLRNGEVVSVAAGGRSLEAPVWVTPGQAANTLTAFLGGGRRLPGQVGDDRGYDAYALLPVDGFALGGVTLGKTGRRVRLAVTQPQQDQQGRDLVRRMTREQAATAPARPRRTVSLYPDTPPFKPSWGMVIDTDTCIGCNACVTACDAENNIAMVGPEQVAMGRAMHWLRVDHYVDGDGARDSFQPVPCMHCEQAPCEMGCPVNAAVHSPDGLNLQVYNRCIGTRTCSSYCPYKVRRFNWFDYTAGDGPERQAQRNPNVTVRARGVMEKCTYCIQRIRTAQIDAELAHRPLADGEVRTACQQTCPTDAIVFGDLSDPASAVSRARAQGRNYVLLEEANTRPRTSYLARLDASPDAAGGDA